MGNLSLGAFMIALSGMVIVFIVLAGLCHLIPLISKVVQSTEQSVKSEATAPSRPASMAVTAPAETDGSVRLIDVDEKTAACIMAIVSHESGTPLSSLIFKTIRAI